jgi:LPXTG-motif cell wall-anchored protein
MTRDEALLLVKLLPSYLSFVAGHKNTLLPRYLGLYRITIENSEIWIFAHTNVFSSYLPISERYDLKGSYAGRRANEKEIAKGSLGIFKDEDYIERGRQLNFTSIDDMHTFTTSLEADVRWLQENNLMDYSLLVGLINREHEGPREDSSRFEVCRIKLGNGSFQYAIVGLVDILMEYNWLKRLESSTLGVFISGISCQHPVKYGDRLLEFINFITFHDGNGPSKSQTEVRAMWLARAKSGFLRLPELGRKDLNPLINLFSQKSQDDLPSASPQSSTWIATAIGISILATATLLVIRRKK